MEQSADNRHRMAGQEDLVFAYSKPEYSSAAGCLISGQLPALQLVRPVRGESRMRGAGYGVFVHADAGRKETGYKIDALPASFGGYRNGAGRQALQCGKIRTQAP